MNNQLRRELLQRHRASGFPGSILDVYKAYDQGVDLIGEYQQKMMQEQQPQVAQTPEQQREGLRPQHAAGNTNASMIFPNVPPNQPFNTVGMKAPINIQKFDNQGHLVKSYENVPPGIKNLPMGPHQGTVLETPAQMQNGGVRKAQAGLPPLTLGQTSPDWKATGPGLRIDGQTYQNSQLTGATRVPLNPETGDQLPIMLPAAEVVGRRNYDDSIAEAISRTNFGLLGSQTSAQDYAQMENAVRSGMNTTGNNMLAAAGDILSSPQRYAVNAPLAYAMGKTPNLSMFPSADRNVGINQPNAYPSETLGVTNPIGAFAVDALTDPTAVAGIGALGRAGVSRAKGLLRNASQDVNQVLRNTSLPSALNEHKLRFPRSLEKAQDWMYDWSTHPETRRRTAALTTHPLSGQPMTVTGGKPISEYVDNFDYAIQSGTSEGKNVSGYSSVHNPRLRNHSSPIVETSSGKTITNATLVTPDPYNPGRETSVGIHELTHSQYPEEFIKSANMISQYDPSASRVLDPSRSIFREGVTEEALSDLVQYEKTRSLDDNFLGYLANPTEQHARIMQLRHAAELTPGQHVSSKFVEALQYANSKDQIVDPKFFEIYKSPEALAKLFNTLPGLAPIAGGALATGTGIGLLNDNTTISPQMKSGGIRKAQAGEFLQSDNTKVSTPTPQTTPTLNPPRFEPKSQGTITQAPYDSSDFWRDVKAHNLQDDSTFENIVEAFDPTGVSSWDDAYRAYTSMQNRGAMIPNFDEALDMFGAIPFLGKAKFAFNLAKKAQKPLAYYGTQFYNNVGRHVINNVNRADALEDETGFLNEMQGGGFTPAPRMGVMQNPGGSVSTHKYATETLDGENWFSFPTLFQNPDSSWIDMEPKEGEDWYPAYEEALRRGEVLYFGKDKERALEWGKGSWKDSMKNGGVRKYQEGGQNPFFAFTPPVTPGSWDHTLFDINYNWGPDQIGDTLDLNALDLIAIERMGVQNPEDVRPPIQYHESGSQQRMQPNAVQISGTEGKYYMGPGRGYYMYDRPSTLRDANRLRTISNNIGVKPPQFVLDLIKSKGTASADTLTAEQQDMLMMANLIMDPKAPFAAYGAGEASLEDLWYKGVNRRSDEDKAREEFRESYDAYEDEDDMLQYLFMDSKPNYFEAQAKKKNKTGGQRKYITRKLRRR